MKRTNGAAITAAILFGMAVPAAHAQRGVGDPTGVARQAGKPEIISIRGEVLEVKTGPCENTTGWSPLGSHFLMKTKSGETLNIHLGPASQVAFLTGDLSAGTKVKVEGFRTEKMEKGHYVARAIAYEDRTVELRDANLQPVWAAAQGGSGGAPRAGFGPGQGRGAGFGYGRGGGYGRGFGRQGGLGPGRGRSAAMDDRAAQLPRKTAQPTQSERGTARKKVGVEEQGRSTTPSARPPGGYVKSSLALPVTPATLDVPKTSRYHGGQFEPGSVSGAVTIGGRTGTGPFFGDSTHCGSKDADRKHAPVPFLPRVADGRCEGICRAGFRQALAATYLAVVARQGDSDDKSVTKFFFRGCVLLAVYGGAFPFFCRVGFLCF